MPRLRNKVTGAVMSVPESTAARLGSAWVPADVPAIEPVGVVEPKATTRTRKSNATK